MGKTAYNPNILVNYIHFLYFLLFSIYIHYMTVKIKYNILFIPPFGSVSSKFS